MARIYCELESQLSVLDQLAHFDPTTAGARPSLNLNVAIWEASKGSENVFSINNAALLDSIVWAYRSLVEVDHLITRLQNAYYASRPGNLDLRSQTQLIGDLKIISDEALRSVKHATRTINASGIVKQKDGESKCLGT